MLIADIFNFLLTLQSYFMNWYEPYWVNVATILSLIDIVLAGAYVCSEGSGVRADDIIPFTIIGVAISWIWSILFLMVAWVLIALSPFLLGMLLQFLYSSYKNRVKLPKAEVKQEKQC